MEQFPLIENLFHKIDLPFVEEPINSEYNKNDIVRVSKVLLEIIENIREKMRSMVKCMVNMGSK